MDPILNKRCAVCGRVPTRRLTIRRQVGKVLSRTYIRLDKSLCQEHGIEVTKSYMGKTMAQGWWGIISFFSNIFIIIADLRVLNAYKRMPEPLQFGEFAHSAEAPPMRRFDGSVMPTPF